MTQINRTDLDKILYVDQALVWCVTQLTAANHDENNFFVQDNIAVRPESEEFVSWAVVQDDTGVGQFIYSALLPLQNKNPLLAQSSIAECIASYTTFRLPQQQITFPTNGMGMLLPEIPPYVLTLEKLLFWLVQLVEGVQRYISVMNALIEANFIETPDQPLPTINIDDGVPLISGLESVAPIIEGVANDGGGAEGIISQYENGTTSDFAVPAWYEEAINNISNGSSGSGGGSNGNGNTNSEPKPVDPGNGNQGAVIDTLPVCKEQDPTITSYSANGILTFTNIKP